MPPVTAGQLIEQIDQRFAGANLSYGHGTDNAWDEAVALVLGVTGLADDRAVLDTPLGEAQVAEVERLAQARIDSRVPLAYLLGSCQYMGLTFGIRPGVIVPRSPIGYLLADGLGPWLPKKVEYIIDLCCGSGCLGIVAAHVFPEAKVSMYDLSRDAVALARENIAAHGLTDRVEAIQADVCAPLELKQPAQLIISNPPYVDAADMSSLPAEYRAEPELALAAGEDGLAIMRHILAGLPDWLAPGGLFVGEVGASAPALARAFPQLPLLWLDLPNGGEGVFALEADALTSHTARR